MRQELVDVFFRWVLDQAHLYHVAAQSLGIQAAGNPYSGYRYAVGRDIAGADWPSVYDLVSRVWDEVPEESRECYVTEVNRVLAANKVAWDLGDDGGIHRVLPPAIQAQIEAAFQELSATRFASALSNFQDAIAAYDARPRRERDTCANIMDALEAVAKTVLNMPNATLGDVLNEVRKQNVMAAESVSVLQKLYDMSNRHFRHGMTGPFELKTAEVDFVFVSCLAGILLFVRL